MYTIHSLSGDHDPNFAFFSGLVIGRKLFKLKEYKNIFPYFAPVVEEYDMLDINSFYNQIEDGERQNYTIQQLQERAQETAFRMIFNYRTRPFRERNDADAVAARAEIQAELLQVFPFGLGKRNMATYEGDLSQYKK